MVMLKMIKYILNRHLDKIFHNSRSNNSRGLNVLSSIKDAVLLGSFGPKFGKISLFSKTRTLAQIGKLLNMTLKFISDVLQAFEWFFWKCFFIRYWILTKLALSRLNWVKIAPGQKMPSKLRKLKKDHKKCHHELLTPHQIFHWQTKMLQKTLVVPKNPFYRTIFLIFLIIVKNLQKAQPR